MIKPPINKKAESLRLSKMVLDYRASGGFVSRCPPGVRSDKVKPKSFEQRRAENAIR